MTANGVATHLFLGFAPARGRGSHEAAKKLPGPTASVERSIRFTSPVLPSLRTPPLFLLSDRLYSEHILENNHPLVCRWQHVRLIAPHYGSCTGSSFNQVTLWQCLALQASGLLLPGELNERGGKEKRIKSEEAYT